jgi:hypothetical protein
VPRAQREVYNSLMGVSAGVKRRGKSETQPAALAMTNVRNMAWLSAATRLQADQTCGKRRTVELRKQAYLMGRRTSKMAFS